VQSTMMFFNEDVCPDTVTEGRGGGRDKERKGTKEERKKGQKTERARSGIGQRCCH
jgi:hypothetical protein